MRTYFLSGQTDQPNFKRAWSLLPDLLPFPACQTIRSSYLAIKEYHEEEYPEEPLFAVIEDDNWILDDRIGWFLNQCKQPTVFYTTNKFGVIYGHGGVKVLNTEFRIPIYAIDCSYYYGMGINTTILSEHRFRSLEDEQRACVNEIIKLLMRSDENPDLKALLTQWASKAPHHYLTAVAKLRQFPSFREVRQLFNRTSG